jgi:hypothetical protein
MEGQIERASAAGMTTTTQGAMGSSLAKSGETSATVLAEREKAAVLARFFHAQRYPRDVETARIRILKDCERPRFADVVTYELPRGDKTVRGPSIHLAKACAKAWGNVDVADIITYEDDEKRHVRVTATDLEANTTYSTDVTISKVVERSTVRDAKDVVGQRTNSHGKPVYIVRANETDLLAKHNALVSKARRTLIFAIIPEDIVEEAQERAAETLRNTDAADPDSAKRRVFDGFAKLNVEPLQLAEALGVPVAQIGPAQTATLRGWFASIRDGETTIAELLAKKKPADEPTADVTSGSSATSKIRSAAKAVANAAKPNDTPAPAESTPDEAKAKAKARAEAIARGEDPDA